MKDGTTSWASSQTLTSGTAPLNGTDGVEFDGATGGIEAGASEAIGDVNGDGIPDLLIGAPDASPNGASSGSVYVIFGTTTPWTTPQTLNSALFNSGAAGFELDGGTSAASGSNYWGSSLATGDVNGDGIADIVVGSNSYYGYAGVVYGGSGSWSGTPYTLSSAGILNGTNGFTLANGGAHYFGIDPSAVADVNGDGYADILSANSYYSSKGNYLLVFGKSTWPATTTVTSTWLNGSNGAQFTTTDSATTITARAGDINGDGINDIFFGNWDANATVGNVYVLFGHKNAVNNPWPTSAFNLNGL